MEVNLSTRQAAGGMVREERPGRWRMEIPAGRAGEYRWAQLDDHLGQPRAAFPWRAPLRFDLRARVSANNLPGTWGFGLWNDPFSASFGISGAQRRLPALPNAAWFFYAAAPNYLALRDTHPAQGFLAASFSSLRIPTMLFLPGVIALPLLALPPTARLLRRAARLFVKEDAALVQPDPTDWHAYSLEWRENRVAYFVDGLEVCTTSVSPGGPLGLVIWIDNQYAAFPPSGKLRFGTSPNPQPAWLEVEDIAVRGV